MVPGGPGLVAAGSAPNGEETDAAVWVSTDGQAWTRIEDDAQFGGPRDQRIVAVSSVGLGLVAIGEDWSGGPPVTVAWVSPDGYEWERVDDTALEDGTVNALVAGGPGLVAAGYEWLGGDWTAAIWVSADGRTWERIEDPNLGDGQIEAVAAGGPGLVAAGYTYDSGGSGDAVIWVSIDGYTWERIDDRALFGGPGQQEIHALAAGREGLVAADWSGLLWVSADGYSWARVDASADFAGGTFSSLAAWEGGFVAAGSVDSGNWETDAAVWLSMPPG